MGTGGGHVGQEGGLADIFLVVDEAHEWSGLGLGPREGGLNGEGRPCRLLASKLAGGVTHPG